MKYRTFYSHVLLAACALLLSSTPLRAQSDADVQAFDELSQRVQQGVGTASSDDLNRMLEMARKIGRPYEGHVAIKGYLSRNQKLPAEVVLPAARNASLAGDYRAAVSRYRSYLEAASPSETSSQAAAELFQVTLEFLERPDEAFEVMSEFGNKHRKTANARSYDRWFTRQAASRGDAVALGNRLAAIFAEKLPVESERYHFWDSLDEFGKLISRADDSQFAAANSTKLVSELIRGDNARKAQFNFYAEHLKFHAERGEKTEEELEGAFKPVAAAAAAYFKADPSSDALINIMDAFLGGHDVIDTKRYAVFNDHAEPVFADLFVQLKADEQVAILDWVKRYRQGRSAIAMHPHIASADTWAAIGAKSPAAFKQSTRIGEFGFVRRADTAEVFKQQAKFTSGIPSAHAAAVNSVAASNDLAGMFKHLLTKETWHLSNQQPYATMRSEIWPAYQQIENAKSDTKITGDPYYKAVVAAGESEMVKSPVVWVDTQAASEYLVYAFRYGGKDDKDKAHMVDRVKSLAWVPYSEDDRKKVFAPAYEEFKKWNNALTTQREKDPKSVDAAVLKQVSPIEDAFSKALAGNLPGEAPTAELKLLVQMQRAVEDRKMTEYEELGRKLYASIKDYEAKKLPHGATMMAMLMRTYENFDPYTLHLEIVADQLKTMSPESADWQAEQVMNHLISNHANWRFWSFPKDDSAQVLKLHEVIAKALTEQINKGKVDEQTFAWFRGTHSGSGWNSHEVQQGVIKLLIEKDALKDTDIRISSSKFATTTYMYLVRTDFPGLQGDFGLDRYFDDMYVAEAKRLNDLDYSYFEFSGRDYDNKISGVISDIVSGYKTLPLGYGDDAPKVVYDSADFWRLYGRALNGTDDQRSKLLTQAEAGWGKTRFDAYAMGRGYFEFAASTATPEARKTFFDKLAAFSERAKSVPARVHPPTMKAMSDVEEDSITDAELAVLYGLFPDVTPVQWSANWDMELLGWNVQAALVKRDRHNDLFVMIPHEWKIGQDTRNANFQRKNAEFAKSLFDDGYINVAMVYSDTASRLNEAVLPNDVSVAMSQLRTRALAGVGDVIPVPRSHPNYPIFASQAAYLAGRDASAWEQYSARQDLLPNMFKELDVTFLVWLINRHTDLKQFDEADQLAQLVLQWVDTESGGFSPDVRASVRLAYGDISFARREYPRAKAIYESIINSTDFNETRTSQIAQLRVARVYAATDEMDQATEILEKLIRHQDPSVRTEAHYTYAVQMFEQEDFDSAQEQLTDMFLIEPNHALGRILEGRIKLQLKKIDQVTDLRIGPGSDKEVLIPGKKLQITLKDQSLAVVGEKQNIEIRAWAEKSGDEEFINLFPLSEDKTLFEGSVPTELAPTRKGDGVLQVLGNDMVRYTFSEKFVGAAQVAQRFRSVRELRVLTDPQLFVSSGRILSPEEEEELRLEAQIRQKLQLDQDVLGQMTLNARRQGDQIKPGNPINVRVLDADRSTTNEIDKLVVLAQARSGDELSVELTETEAHSGVFEGSIPTASGQATAFASDSTDGSDPNFAVSSRSDFPAWMAQQDGVKPKTFSVDLNDNVALGQMQIMAGETGHKIKAFRVETSINGRDFTAVGSWPKALEPWDGSPRIHLARLGGRTPSTLSEFRSYISSGHTQQNAPKVTAKVETVGGKWDGNILGHSRNAGITSSRHSYVANVEGAFFIEQRQRRTFTLIDKNRGSSAKYLLAIDGKVQGDGTTFTDILGRGVHRIDVFIVAPRNTNVDFDLQCDSPEPPYTITCPPDMFSPEKHPQIKQALYREPAEITAERENSRLQVQFAVNTNARIIRLVLEDFETDAPAIKKIYLTDVNGKQILPTEDDFLNMKQNKTLEIVAGDRVTVRYTDPTPITEGNKAQERFLTAMFSDGELSAAFVEFTMSSRGERVAEYFPMRRFQPGNPVNVFVKDPDMDVTPEPDRITFTARTDDGQQAIIQAMETEANSGVFLGKVFPVAGEPARKVEVKIQPGQDLRLEYVDTENTDPGVPWKRIYAVEQAWYQTPEMRLFEVRSRQLTEGEKQQLAEAEKTRQRSYAEKVPVNKGLVAIRPETETATDAEVPVVLGGPLLTEVVFPFRALSPKSELYLYAQSETARKQMGLSPDQFDPNVPGTIKVMATPRDALGGRTSGGAVNSFEAPDGYAGLTVQGDRFAADALDAGRFTFRVPYELGMTPPSTLIDEEPWLDRELDPTPLSVTGNDTVVVGFKYEDEQGKEHWTVRRIKLTSDVFFDVMDRRYHEVLNGTHVGESIYFRVIHRTRDISDDKDTVTITVKTATGESQVVELSETFNHSGEFKGLVHLVYKAEPGVADQINALPVDYGDVVTSTYQPYDDGEAFTSTVEVFKGDDGEVLPFTKRFKDPEIAVQTQFTVAEAYFELAKKYRELENEAFARRSIAQGQKLLEEALRDYPDTEYRAQANYLLGNLAFEFAQDAQNNEIKQSHYAEALKTFGEIVSEYPDSPYAPKAQFKKALVLEMKGEIDKACEEYVKLSYRYPDNELVAQTIARLGQYFLTKGREFDEQQGNVVDKIEAEKIRIKAQNMYKTAAEVFGRLSVRFPQHNLATKTLVLSAQCYMRAEMYDDAIEVFESVYEDTESDNLLRAESMYWAGDSQMKKPDAIEAYRVFKQLTWDFPETVWAKYARGRLTEEALLRVGEADASGR